MNKLDEIIERAVEDVLCPVVEETSAPTLMKAACRQAVREALELVLRKVEKHTGVGCSPHVIQDIRDIRALAEMENKL